MHQVDRLNGTLQTLDGLGFDVAIDPAPGPDWIALDRYVSEPRRLDAALHRAAARFDHHHDAAMAGGWLVAEIAAAVAWPATAALLAHDLLIVDGANLVHLPDPRTERRRAARVTPARRPTPATPERYARSIADTLAPAVDTVHRRTRRGRHALWGTVTDMVAASFHRAGDYLHQSERARTLAERIIDDHDLLPRTANWREVHWARGTERTRIRNICCLWYRADGGGTCITCPRVTDSQRRDLLAERRP